MSNGQSIVISNALCADGKVRSLRIEGGVVRAMSERPADVRGTDEHHLTKVDVEGRLLLPSLVEAHAHLDKSLTADLVPNPAGDLMGAIHGWRDAESSGVINHEGMVERVAQSLEMLLAAGVTAVRSHINVGGPVGTRYLIASQEAAERFRRTMHIEFVALTYMPMSGEGSAENLRALREAIDLGVDAIGGCPHLEPDAAACIDVALELAAHHSRKVDLHVDETLDPTSLTLDELVTKVEKYDLSVTASHCVSLGMVPQATADRIAQKVSKQQVSIVALPQTNLFLQGRSQPVATPRGLTAISALRAAGANLVAGADNAQDPFNLVGRNDPLETAALMVMAGHLLPEDAYATVSSNARRALGIAEVAVAVGSPADFIAVRTHSVRQTIAEAPADRIVFKDGEIVARSTVTRDFPTLNA